MVANIPQISQRGDAMMAYKGRMVYLIWEEQEEGDEMAAGFAPLRLLADSSLSMPSGFERTTSLAEGVLMLQQILGVGPWEDTPTHQGAWADVEGTELDTRTLQAV